MIGYTVALVADRTSDLHDVRNGSDLPSRVAAGDRGAFLELYRAHFPEVRAFAQRLLGCPMAADDLVHDLFLGLPRALRAFRGDCPLRSYILSIAVRSARNYLRAAKRRRAAEARAVLEPLVAHGQPDRTAEERELARLLNDALDCLPLEQRVAFVLCEVEGRTSVEAGEILGEPPGTLRARVFHGKRKLRERLAELARERGIPVSEEERR